MSTTEMRLRNLEMAVIEVASAVSTLAGAISSININTNTPKRTEIHESMQASFDALRRALAELSRNG